MHLDIAKTVPSKDYELLDSGEGEKLERYGKYTFRRPDPQVLWNKNLSEKEWDTAHFSFRRDGKKGDWIVAPGVPEKWQIEFGDLKFWIRPTAFKHTGLFPEQQPNWDWMKNKIKDNHPAGWSAHGLKKIKRGEFCFTNFF